MTSMKKLIAVALTATTLAIPVTAAELPSIRVSSYKGSTLDIGECSDLMIGPSGAEYTVTSSNPDTIMVEQMLTFWVVIAKVAGTAEITVSNSVGEYGTETLAVDPAILAGSISENCASLTDNLKIQQETIRLIDQTRRANGVSGLPVSDALMNAAQYAVDS